MTQINKYYIFIKNFIKFVAELAVDVVRFAISQIRNKKNINKETPNKPKPFYQERNRHGYPAETHKANSK